MAELEPCPFCNGTHSINVINFFTGDSYRKCDICGAEAPEAKTPEEAAKVWNTRPAEDALKAEVERLKADNERLKKALKKIDDLTFMPRNKDKALDGTWHITRAALAPDMNVATKESEDSHE